MNDPSPTGRLLADRAALRAMRRRLGHQSAQLLLDLSDVRRAGAPIRGMQGRPASGPISLLRAFLNIRAHVIEPARAGTLPPWEQALMIDHHLSVEVQVGGARRAARMATKSWRDPAIIRFIRSKSEGGLWTANHSVMVDADFWARVRTPDDTNADALSRHAHAVSVAAAIAARSVASNGSTSASAQSPATACSAASSRPDRTTRAPCAASARANAAPMPEEAPVIHAVCPENVISVSLNLYVYSPGAFARIARAWTRWPGISPSAALTSRWRWSREVPANAALSITTVKCDSPLPSSPLWP